MAVKAGAGAKAPAKKGFLDCCGCKGKAELPESDMQVRGGDAWGWMHGGGCVGPDAWGCAGCGCAGCGCAGCGMRS